MAHVESSIADDKTPVQEKLTAKYTLSSTEKAAFIAEADSHKMYNGPIVEVSDHVTLHAIDGCPWAFTSDRPKKRPDPPATPRDGPWSLDPEAPELVIGPDGKTVAHAYSPLTNDPEYNRAVKLANARRIVEAVNAFAAKPIYTGIACLGTPIEE